MMKSVFRSVFKQEFEDLINSKRAVGFKYESEEGNLKRIDRYLTEVNLQEKHISKEICLNWCHKRSYESNTNQSRRISIMRVFCKYINSLGFPAYIPPHGLTKKSPKYDAHIYTDEEIERFFKAVDKSESVPGVCPYRSLVMPIFFRILYTSGMRVSELRLARIKDINLDKGYIRVQSGKNNKDRIVPINENLIEKCKNLKNEIHTHSPEDEFFFMMLPGKEMSIGNVYKNFRRYLDKAGITHTGKGPRVHDFRHTYCVNLLKKWATEDKDLYAYLPYMRVMLGHESFDETAYYLKLTSNVFPLIKEKLDNAFPNIIREIEFNDKEYY